MFDLSSLMGISPEENDILKQEEYLKQKLQKEEEFNRKYNHAGIYCIKVDGQIIYIGKSVNMAHRVLQHMKEIRSKTQVKDHKYKILHELRAAGKTIEFDVLYYSSRKMDEAIRKDIGYKEGVLIRRYKPALNYQIPKVSDWRSYTVNQTARTITTEELLGLLDQRNFDKM